MNTLYQTGRIFTCGICYIKRTGLRDDSFGYEVPVCSLECQEQYRLRSSSVECSLDMGEVEGPTPSAGTIEDGLECPAGGPHEWADEEDAEEGRDCTKCGLSENTVFWGVD